MTDLTERLRDGCGCNFPDSTCAAEDECRDAFEAADEIDRLQVQVERFRVEIDRLRSELADGSFYKESDIDRMQNEIDRLRAALKEEQVSNAGLGSTAADAMGSNEYLRNEIDRLRAAIIRWYMRPFRETCDVLEDIARAALQETRK